VKYGELGNASFCSTVLTVYLPKKYWLKYKVSTWKRGMFRVSTSYYPVIVVTKIST